MIDVFIKLRETDFLGSVYDYDTESWQALANGENQLTKDNQIIMVSRSIDNEAAKTNFVDLPTAYDGTYDMTGVNGLRRADKTIKIKFRYVYRYDLEAIKKVCNHPFELIRYGDLELFKRLYLGRAIYLRFGDEEEFTWHVGRLVSMTDDYEGMFRTFEITIQAWPYRRTLQKTSETLAVKKLDDINMLKVGTKFEAVATGATMTDYSTASIMALSTTDTSVAPIVRIELPITDEAKHYIHVETTGGYYRIVRQNSSATSFYNIKVADDGSFFPSRVGAWAGKYYLYLFAKGAEARFENIWLFKASDGAEVYGGDRAITPFTLNMGWYQTAPDEEAHITILSNGKREIQKLNRDLFANPSDGQNYTSPFFTLHNGSNNVFAFTSDTLPDDTRFNVYYDWWVI